MRILVVGAGIAGLTFVRALQHFHKSFGYSNLSIEIVERASNFSDGAGIVLHPNGLNVIDAIGLSQDIIPFTNVIDAMSITKNSEEFTIHMKEVWGEKKSTRVILRKDLHTLLAQDLIKISGIPVKLRMGCSLEKISQKEHEVIAHFENGESGIFDLVVGADGIHSKVRKALFPDTPAVSTNLLYFRFVAKNEFGLRNNIWKVIEREEGSYGFIPLTENRIHCFVQLRTTKYPCSPGEEELYFKQSIVPWDPLLASALNNRCGSFHTGFAYMIPPGNWDLGHCVLLGDSAHAVSPTLSEGGSLAMEDALVLSLALCESNSIHQAITVYKEARQERCLRAYRMALSQLNSMGNHRKSLLRTADSVLPTQLMAGMYKPLLENPLPKKLQSLLTQATSGINSYNSFIN